MLHLQVWRGSIQWTGDELYQLNNNTLTTLSALLPTWFNDS